MALDVYVGTLTRYYTREWENVAQRQAREQGLKYTLISPDGPWDKLEKPDPTEVSTVIERWREALNQGLGENISQPLSWDESANAPYFTDRPSYQGYSGLQLWAAYAAKSDAAAPTSLPKEGAGIRIQCGRLPARRTPAPPTGRYCSLSTGCRVTLTSAFRVHRP